MDAKQELTELLADIEGWLPLEDAWYLCEAARTSSDDIVEIGAYRGRSTIALAFGATRAEKPGQVFSVEPHGNFTGIFGGNFGPEDRVAYYQNLLESGMARHAALINLQSAQAAAGWDRQIGMLFIDGDHRYEAVSEDARLWVPHVKNGGLIVFDDTFIPDSGPLKVYQELLGTGEFQSVPAAGKLRSLRKQ